MAECRDMTMCATRPKAISQQLPGYKLGQVLDDIPAHEPARTCVREGNSQLACLKFVVRKVRSSLDQLECNASYPQEC